MGHGSTHVRSPTIRPREELSGILRFNLGLQSLNELHQILDPAAISSNLSTTRFSYRLLRSYERDSYLRLLDFLQCGLCLLAYSSFLESDFAWSLFESLCGLVSTRVA